MKCFLFDPSNFGIPYDHFLISELSRESVEAHFFCRKPRKNEPDIEDQKYFRYEWFYALGEKVVNSGFFKLGRFIKGIEHFLNFIKIYLFFKKEKPEVVHYFWLCLPILDTFFIKLFKKKSKLVLTVHDTKDFLLEVSSQIQLYRVRKTVELFDVLIVHNQRAKQHLIEHGFNIEKIRVIPHGKLKFVSSVAKERFVPKTSKVLLIFGNMRPYKGLDLLVDAFTSLSNEEIKDWGLYIVGKNGMGSDSLSKLVLERKKSEKVFWDIGFATEGKLHSYLDRANAICFPYREIDASGAFMLAASYQKPTLVSDVGIFTDYISDGENGVVVEAGSLDSLKIGLKRLLASPDSFKFGKELPSWNKIAEQTVNTYY